MRDREFKLSKEDIAQLIEPMGGCIATDMITVEGMRVGYMVREPPSRPDDSGWCFTAGVETQEYMDDVANHAIYEVNTIANYDPDIIPLLATPPRHAFVRNPNTGKFVEIPYEEPLD